MRRVVRYRAVVAWGEDAAVGLSVFGRPEGEAAAEAEEVLIVRKMDLDKCQRLWWRGR